MGQSKKIKMEHAIPEGYKHTTIGVIPEEWEIIELRKVLISTFSGGTPSRSHMEYYENGTIPWIKSGEINQINIYKTEECITEEGLINSSAKIAETGTLLYAMYGATAGTVGFTKIPAAINQAVLALVPSTDADKEYLFHYLNFSKSTILKTYTQGAQPNLSASIIKALLIPLPPFRERLKLAAIFNACDSAIEKTQLLISQLKLRNKGLAQQLLTGRKRLSGFSTEWRTIRIGDIFKLENRHIQWDDTAYYNLVSIRRRFGGLFFRGSFSGKEIQVKKLKAIKVNDFLISKRQVSHGAWAVVPNEFDSFLVSDEYDCLSIVNAELLNSRFWKWFCQQPKMTNYAFLDSKGVHIEKLIFHFNQFRKRNLRIPDSLVEQEGIATVLDQADLELKCYVKKLTVLKKQKRGLMQKLLTGQLRVNHFPDVRKMVGTN